jgi:hypothetical protein
MARLAEIHHQQYGNMYSLLYDLSPFELFFENMAILFFLFFFSFIFHHA